MNRMKTLLHRPNLWPLLAANVVLSGCPTYRNAPPQITSTVPLLAALEPGKTTRQKLELSWGAPASTLQEGRIAFYRPEGSGHPRQRHDGRRRRVVCARLKSASIGHNVVSLGNLAFYGCTSLTNITIPNSVTNIGGSAFARCTSLNTVTIGSGVTIITGLAFAYCTNLTSVTLGNSAASIGESAFASCLNLTTPTNPDSVTNIGG